MVFITARVFLEGIPTIGKLDAWLSDVHWSLYLQAFQCDAIMRQMLYQFQRNQRDYFSNDTFRGRSLVSSAVYNEVTPPDTFPLRHIFGCVIDWYQNTGCRELASDEELEAPMEDQPLPADASPTTLSPGNIANSNLKEDEEDPEEDPADYPADGGENDDNESSDDDNDDDDVEKDEEDEEHLAPADPSGCTYSV
ncbi:hypothetical protein Tco_0582110 [Tanacetum coccineum]